MHRIRMSVVQPCEVGALVGDVCISLGMPDLQIGCVVETIDSAGGIGVQMRDEMAERFGGFFTLIRFL